ncbi:hypothetical protein [Actinokineospora sp.]|uniref:hypothetical protein n=1 Tax=Actinokineospora sp. TaxID=1872133 RepID=UPI004037D65C
MTGDTGAVGSGLAAQISQFQQGAQRFVDSATAGGFGISDNAGKAMLAAVHSVLDGLDAARESFERIKQDTMLGTSPDAQVIIAFNREVAAGDNSARSSLLALRDSLTQIEAGITEAMRQYRNTDDDNAAGITRADQ